MSKMMRYRLFRLNSMPVFPETFICGSLPGSCLCKDGMIRQANLLPDGEQLRLHVTVK